MSIVNNYAFKNLRLRLTNVNYWDLVLSSDMRGYDHTTLYCDNIISGDTLLVYMDFNNNNCVSGRTIYSLTTWKDSILPISGLSLCDIGLTGVDNGFVPNLTGETLYISSGDPRFYMTQVTGQTYEYPIIFTGDSSGNYAQFNGGFYQGFYKLFEYDYNIFPERMNKGWSVEMILKPRLINEYFPGLGETTLNELYPNNKNTFFFIYQLYI